MDPVHPEPAVREKARQYLHYCTDLAVRMGAKKVAGPISSAPVRYWISGPEQRRQELDLCATAMREAAEYADDKGVVLAIEFLNRFESSFINTVADACALVDAVDHPASGVLVDTFHLNIEAPVIEDSIRACGDRIFHFHVADSNRWYPGAGHLDFDSILDALFVTGYQGYVSGEFMPLPDADTSAERSIAYLRKL